MGHSETEILIAYLQAHPLVALVLGILVVMFLGSLLRKLIKLAVVLVVVILIGMYWTRHEADADWRARAEILRQRAETLGQEALDKGRRLWDQGREELQQHMQKSQDRKKREAGLQ